MDASCSARAPKPSPGHWFRKHVPGAAGQPHRTITGAGHFLQEEKGPEIAALVAAFVTG